MTDLFCFGRAGALGAVLAMAGASQVLAQDMQGAPTRVERIVVTASPIVRSADEFSRIITVVDRDAVLAKGGASVADALMDTPGISGTGFAPGANRPIIRGFDATRVLLTENGIGSLDVAEIGPDHGTPLDSLAATRIEIVRGAATLRYGSQAIGGVINIITDRIPDRMIDGAEGELVGIFSSAARSGEGAFQANAGSDFFSIHADGFTRNGGDYSIRDGKQPNSFVRMSGGAIGAAALFDQGSLGAAYVRYDAKYGLPAGDTFIEMRQDKLAGRGAWTIGAGALERVTFELGHADYKHQEIEPGVGPAATFRNEEVDARAEVIFSGIGPASDMALGLHIQDRDFSALGEAEDYLLPARARGVAGYAFARFGLTQQVDLEAAVRLETAHRKGTPSSGTPASRSFEPVSAAAGVVWKVSDGATLGLTASTAARVPALPELFAIGPHDGPETFEIGDPDLDLEHANSLEAAMRLRQSGLELTGALWASWYDGFIFGELTGRTCDDTGVCIVGPGLELQEMLYVQRDAEFWGFEAEARYALVRVGAATFGVLAQADYVRGELQNGDFVPRLTPFRYGPGVYAEGKDFSASIRVLRVEAQDNLAPFETRTPGYTDVSAEVTYRAYDDDEHALDLAFAARNLTDAEQRNASSFVKDEVEMPGRHVKLVARLTF